MHCEVPVGTQVGTQGKEVVRNKKRHKAAVTAEEVRPR
jgi:hypothetical protein